MTSSITDQMAMDEIAQWVDENDPTLDNSIPNWVWDLMGLLDDLIDETGRNGSSYSVS